MSNSEREFLNYLKGKDINTVGIGKLMTAEMFDELYDYNSAIVICVTEDIINNNFVKYLTSFYNAILNSKKGKSCRYIISTNAYDNDRREVYQVPEYVNFMRNTINEIPALLSLLDLQASTWLINMLCADEVSRASKRVSLTGRAISELGQKVVFAMSKDGRFTSEDIEKFKNNYSKLFNLSVSDLF